MTSPLWPGNALTRWSRRLLGVMGRLVPRELRAEWLQEWEAELWQLRSGDRPRYELALFLMGALWHAIWERREGWRMDTILQDIRFAVRTLWRSPGFSAAAIVTLALSIGASTSLFTVVEAALLAKPPYPEPDRLVVVDMLFRGPDTEFHPSQWSYPRMRALRDEVRTVDDLAGYESRTMTLTELGDPMVIAVEVVTPSIFPLLGISSVRGRVFGPDEEDHGSAAMAALVSHDFWQTRMGRSPAVVGSLIELDGLAFQVVGVLPSGFDGVTGGAEVWIPMSALRRVLDDSALDDAWNQHFNVMGRLAPGVELEQARGEVEAFGATVMDRFPAPVAASRLRSGGDVVPYMEARQNKTTTTSMMALFAAVILVLLIATANLAGLLLSRGAGRLREAAVRASLGAGRGRIARQMLTESLVLSAVGGVVGLLLAAAAVGTLGTWLTDALGTGGGRGLEYLDQEARSINWTVLLFALTTTGGVGLAFGLLPAWQVARSDPAELLKGGSGGLNSQRRGLVGLGRNGLIAGQVALALVLLSAASLMFRSMVSQQQFDAGFERENLLTAMYSLTPSDEQAGIDPGTFHVDVLQKLRALPGVTGATLGEVPLAGPTFRNIVLGSEGRPELDPTQHTWIRIQPVADGHLSVLGATLLEGRDIEPGDDWNTERVVVLGRTAAQELFPDGSPIGRRIQLGWPGFGGRGATVVGVAEDIQFGQPGDPIDRQAYVSVRQAPQLATGILVRTTGDPEALIPSLRSAVAELAPNLALTSVLSMEARAWSSSVRPRVLTGLLAFFGFVALLLVAVGLYGTIAYTVTRRTRELGLRASLGANRLALAALVLKQGVGVTLVGITLGLVASSWANGALRSLLVGVEPFDPLGLVVASAVLFIVALVAALVPARRGMRVDPMVALRAE